jgi:hypothetical protein
MLTAAPVHGSGASEPAARRPIAQGGTMVANG